MERAPCGRVLFPCHGLVSARWPPPVLAEPVDHRRRRPRAHHALHRRRRVLFLDLSPSWRWAAYRFRSSSLHRDDDYCDGGGGDDGQDDERRAASYACRCRLFASLATTMTTTASDDDVRDVRSKRWTVQRHCCSVFDKWDDVRRSTSTSRPVQVDVCIVHIEDNLDGKRLARTGRELDDRKLS